MAGLAYGYAVDYMIWLVAEPFSSVYFLVSGVRPLYESHGRDDCAFFA